MSDKDLASKDASQSVNPGFVRDHIFKELGVNYQWSEIVLDQHLHSKKEVNVGNKAYMPYGNEDEWIQSGDRVPDAPNLALIPAAAEPTTTMRLLDLLTTFGHTVLDILHELPRLFMQLRLHPYFGVPSTFQPSTTDDLAPKTRSKQAFKSSSLIIIAATLSTRAANPNPSHPHPPLRATPPTTFMANAIKINAPEHDIEQVTVYGDRAEIRRKFPVEMQAGQNEAVVSRLPVSRLRVHRSSPQNVDEDGAISSLEERVAAVESRRAFLTKQEKVLSSYSDTLSSQYANASQLASFLDPHRTTNRSIYEERTALDKEYKSLSKELDDARKRTNSEIQAKRASSVMVTVLSEEPGPAQLILIYGAELLISNLWLGGIICEYCTAVYGASWSSLYDVRASVDSHFASKKAESPPISLQYRACLSRETSAVHLAISVPLLRTLNNQFDAINDRLDAIDGRLDTIDGRLDVIDSRLDGIDGRLGGIDGRLDANGRSFILGEALAAIPSLYVAGIQNATNVLACIFVLVVIPATLLKNIIHIPTKRQDGFNARFHPYRWSRLTHALPQLAREAFVLRGLALQLHPVNEAYFRAYLKPVYELQIAAPKQQRNRCQDEEKDCVDVEQPLTSQLIHSVRP
ncbi:hypothetical protein BS47DRAFT_1398676 [Hydnum rufescens UP504]|uniref:Uncharacterized protein n=1 Tax=Hydnum rufescens UP504 TaxID=1448309 RepID=A0A9P6AKE5_9AGAM|nr:hypothetical protein BS47DRAFT_1398676 [Hydnum rufescens UP504]